MKLKNKTALITGAARGIGLEFARAYIAEGARVALTDAQMTRLGGGLRPDTTGAPSSSSRP